MSSRSAVHAIFTAIAAIAAVAACAAGGGPSFTENKGQWHPDVLFRTETDGNYGYIDKGGLTLLLLDSDFSTNLHDHMQGRGTEEFGNLHALKFRFTGMDMSVVPEKRNRTAGPFNYFLGNDRTRWSTDVYGYESIAFRNVKPGIDLRYDLKNGSIKYEFIVAPEADPSEITVEIQGAESLRIEDGALIAETSVGPLRELPPFAFQRDENGKITTVPCTYRLRKNKVTYEFPKGYDTSLPLIIDPEIAFSSYIGSASSNFGFTASYDDEGNLYSGAIVFGANYPTTTGAFQVNFNGSNVDCAITKFNADGTALLYSTYIGGSTNEAPHSIVVSEAGEAYIFGTTGSDDFPTSANAYQAGYNGGTNDGIALNTPFNFNYGDLFRGEIVIDGDGNAYVASVTASADFPIQGGYSANHTGELSGVIFKLNPDLSQLLWSTYSGGNADESAVSVQLAADNTVYFAGGTFSTDLATGDPHQAVNAGGSDGYIGRISADGGTLLNCTYTGTGNFDLNYFVQIDTEGFVYAIGQTLGNYPVSPGLYTNPNSGQYIHKFSGDLGTSLWSTVVGTGTGGADFSPSAFLVSVCGQIYVAGWGGVLNDSGGSTSGLPVTPDAFQSTTDGNDFYVMVLSPDAENLVYGTFFGGSQSQEHVDGGTSRFDKNGTVYQAVCAGCGGNSDFPTQPGVWSQTNGSNNCNLAVFKFKLSAVQTAADIEAPEVICPGTEVNFINLSVDAENFEWEFGDGNSSTEFAPSHTYTTPGTYTVWLFADSNDGCLAPDSAGLTVEVVEEPQLTVEPLPQICPGETVQLFTDGAESYSWSPADGLDDPSSPEPIFSGTTSTVYTLTGTTACGTDVIEVDVFVGSDAVEISDNTSICPGESVELFVDGATTASWSPPDGLSDPEATVTTASPTETTVYTVTGETEDECGVSGTVQVTVLPPPPELEGDDLYVSCNGNPVQITVSGAEDYSWSPADGLSEADIPNPLSLPESATTYTVTGTNVCGSDDLEITVLVNSILVSMTVDSIVCHGDPFESRAQGGKTYIWQPAHIFSPNSGQKVTGSIQEPTVITVTGFDDDGCSNTEQRLVMLYPRPFFTAGRDRVVSFGDELQIESNSPYPLVWEENAALSCLNCNFPLVSPLETTTFYASVRDENGCIEVDSVTVSIHGNLYVPNAFTPNGDGKNDIFKAEGVDIEYFRMEVFNRWGEMVFESDDIDHGWNGRSPNADYFSPADIYQYRIVARELYGEQFEVTGHITLLR
ncbi:MAG: gliding motility-associated C-terminal domain-containing protein [Flavobacteriales bacterium]|nr:gliding motility-associated C-terminal domain-containing protein [Flavobacteriales bacterium]